MLRGILLFLIIVRAVSGYTPVTFTATNDATPDQEFGSKFTPTRGEAWPRPKSETKMPDIYVYRPRKFDIKITHHSCPILIQATRRFKKSVNKLYRIAVRDDRRKTYRAIHKDNKDHRAIYENNKDHRAIHEDNKVHRAIHEYNKVHRAIYEDNKDHRAIHKNDHRAIYEDKKNHRAIYEDNKNHRAIYKDNKNHRAIYEDNKDHRAIHEDNKDHRAKHEDNNCHGDKKDHRAIHEDNRDHRDIHEDNKDHRAIHEDNRDHRDIHEDNKDHRAMHEDNKDHRAIYEEDKDHRAMHEDNKDHRAIYEDNKDHRAIHEDNKDHRAIYEDNKDHRAIHEDNKGHRDMHEDKKDHRAMHEDYKYHRAIHENNKDHRAIHEDKKDHRTMHKNNNDHRVIHKDKKEEIYELQVVLTNPCEEYPHLNMSEKYELVISGISWLTSDSVWGIMHGLETASQLFYLSDDYSEVLIRSTTIKDYPTYPHRGLLLDTARHYISLNNILKTLDAMAMNKMNVFHWHIVDDQSFPYQSSKYPELSEKGAFYPTMVYTKSNIKDVIEYARSRGIRVIPEIDIPGHTRSWGAGKPELLAECYDEHKAMVSHGLLDPVKNDTHVTLKNLLREVDRLFPDTFLHIGGDEVNLDCWESNPNIIGFMQQHKIHSLNDMLAMFTLEVLDYFEATPIVWQETLEHGVLLPNATVVQVWKKDKSFLEKLLKSTEYRVVYSSPWYVDSAKGSFEAMYARAPRELLRRRVPREALARVLGGEACVWTEMVDDTNVLSRSWPLASAAAEVLWGSERPLTAETRRRIEEHTCRMRRRGIPAQPPNGPGFCVL